MSEKTRDEALDFAVGVARCRDGQPLRKHLAVLALVPDFAFPGTFAQNRLPHLPVELRLVAPGFQDARVLADDLGGGISGDGGKGGVDPDDGALAVGDQHGFERIGEDGIGQLQFGFVTLALADIGVGPDRTAMRGRGVERPARQFAPEDAPVASPIADFAVAVALFGQVAIGRLAQGDPVLAGRKRDLGALAYHFFRCAETEDLGKSPVAVEEDPILDQGDADMGIVENQSLLIQQRGHARLDLREGLVGAFALGDVLQRLDGADQFAATVGQRGRGEVQPSAAIAHVGEVVLGLVGAGNDGRAPIFALIEGGDGIDVAGYHQIGHDGARLGVERAPLVAAADHRGGRIVEHDFAGTIPVRHPMFPVDHEGWYRGTLDDPVEQILFGNRRRWLGFHYRNPLRPSRWVITTVSG
jgi:hypothetical protein